MKKLISSIIIIMPLLLLAILLVSGAIVSLLTHIYVEKIEFSNNETLYLVMDDEQNPPKYNLGNEVTILPLKATERGLLFNSGDEGVATVSSDGEISASFYGETYITVTSKENAAAFAQKKVVVTDDSVHELQIVTQGLKQSMYQGDTQTLSVVVLPKEATNKSVSWSSSDSSILNVSAGGTLTAVGSGKAKAIVTSDDDPTVKAEVEVTCYQKVEDVLLDKTPILTSAATEKFPQVTVQPSAFGVKLSYTSDDENIATVDETGNITFHQAGHVKITVRATDFGDKFVEQSKEYTSTFGYYMGPLFEFKNYTVDYDEYSDGSTLPIRLLAAPQGSYRLIKKVTYSTNNVLDFDPDAKTFKFVGEMPVGTTFVDVFVTATVYDTQTNALKEDYRDSFRLNVTRNATTIVTSYNGTETNDIQTTQRSITFSTNQTKSPTVVNVTVGPANHTNKIEYQLLGGEGIATLSNNALKFDKTGSVIVKILLKKAGNTNGISKEVTVSYTQPTPEKKPVVFDDLQQTNQSVALDMRSPSDKDTGIIYFSTPEGAKVDYRVVEVPGKQKVVDLQLGDNGNYSIIPLRGGEATIEITVSYPTAVATMALEDHSTKVYSITVYVDRSVTADDFTILLNGSQVPSLRTSLTSVQYSVTVNDDDGRMEGKELFVVCDGKSVKATTLTNFAGTVEFADKTDLTVSFQVRYSPDVQDKYYASEDSVLSFVERKISTTCGNLDKFPTVRYDGDKILSDGAKITFDDLNQQIVFTVEGPFDPADFVLDDHLQMESTPFVNVQISNDTITLTSLKGCKGQTMSLNVGGQTAKITVDVHVKADQITVSCDGEQLNAAQHYTTILDKLTFKAVASRKDGESVDNAAVQYSLDNSDWHTLSTDGTEINLSQLNGTIYFLSCDGGATTQINLSKQQVDVFSLKVSVNGDTQIDFIESVNDSDALSYYLPSTTQGSVTLSVTINGDFLGGVGDDTAFAQLFAVDLGTTGWTVTHNAASKQITVKFADGQNGFIDQQLTLKVGAIRLEITLSLVHIASIGFTGFDMGTFNDVHPGYQQARVFAKKSFYNDTMVDYFKMPYKAESDIGTHASVASNAIVWSLIRYVGNQPQTLVRQHGKNVEIGQQSYTIVEQDGQYVLKDANGTVVSGVNGQNTNGYVWIDVFTEPGYARIYFGNFKGLREVDVQNDYFGNFDDKPTWTQPQQVVDDHSGRAFDVSAQNSFTFLRVEAGDGVEGGTNCHFNFNVLDDATLVNVFDAKGYYANSNIVLHENLYGVGELGNSGDDFDKATEKGLFLDHTNSNWASMDDNVLGKSTIYGNGYQINLQAKNEALKTNDPNNKNNSHGVRFGKLYNVKVKGENPTENINVLEQKIVLQVSLAYYCDLQYYTKCRPLDGGMVYIKNTVLHSASQSGFQLYYTNEKAYLENVTVVDCAAGLTNEKTLNGEEHQTWYYFKGDIDVLNYTNLRGVAKMANLSDSTLGLLSMLVGNDVAPHYEWFGQKCKATNDIPYFNLVIYTSNKNCSYNYWDGTKYVENNENVTVGDNVPMNRMLDLAPYKSQLSGAEVTVWTYNYPRTKTFRLPGMTYDYKISVDGRNPNTNGGTQYFQFMFTEERYIRLLCQYVSADADGTNLVKNDDHILWHIQQAYRDKSLITGRNNDHMAALRASLTGKGITWHGSDGDTTPEQAMKEYDEYQAQLAATARA